MASKEYDGCERVIDVFYRRSTLPDKPILRDDLGQYSMDKDYALKLRKLRYHPASLSKDTEL